MFKFTELQKPWINVTAPVAAVLCVRPAVPIRCVAIATERDQRLGMANLTAHPQEAVLQATTVEILLELALNIPQQFPPVRGQLRSERRVVFGNSFAAGG